MLADLGHLSVEHDGLRHAVHRQIAGDFCGFLTSDFDAGGFEGHLSMFRRVEEIGRLEMGVTICPAGQDRGDGEGNFHRGGGRVFLVEGDIAFKAREHACRGRITEVVIGEDDLAVARIQHIASGAARAAVPKSAEAARPAARRVDFMTGIAPLD